MYGDKWQCKEITNKKENKEIISQDKPFLLL